MSKIKTIVDTLNCLFFARSTCTIEKFPNNGNGTYIYIQIIYSYIKNKNETCSFNPMCFI